MIKEIRDINEVLDFAWYLSQNNTKCSYLKISSKLKLKERLERAIVSDNEKIIACYKNNVLKGICVYRWENEDNYSDTMVFVIDTDYNSIADEMIDYIKNELPNFDLFIGVPFDNIEANTYFKERNVECIESSYDIRLKRENYVPKTVNKKIEKIDSKTFDEYATFHDKYAGDMYWTSERLKNTSDNFIICAYRYKGEIAGSIFVKKYTEGADVFGMFLDNKLKYEKIGSELICFMLNNLCEEYDDVEEVVYFVDEHVKEELEVALSLGFKINDTYRCYKIRLS